MAKIDTALTTLSRYKDHKGITHTRFDTRLTMMIIAVSKFVERYCDRAFGREVISGEVYDGYDSDKLLLKKYPVDENETFTLQRRTVIRNQSSWETINSQYYFVDYMGGIITYQSADWALRDPFAPPSKGFAKGVQNYRVSYTAGFYLPSSSDYQNEDSDDELDLPYDLEMAVIELVAWKDARRKTQGDQSERVRDVAVTYQKFMDANPELKEVLSRYRRPRYA